MSEQLVHSKQAPKTCIVVATVASACGVAGTGEIDSQGHYFQVENRLWHISH